MNSIKHRFTLDMHSTQSQISLPASLHDTARTLYINFTDGGTPYHISEGCTALLIISKPSGAKLYEWCAIRDNTNVVYPFSQNKSTASEAGISECEITLYSAPDEDGDTEQIASPRFSIVVSERAINQGDDEVLPETSIGFIDKAIEDELVRRQKEQARLTAETARATAETLRASAEKDRANAESKRATAETERASAESARKTAENARASAETARASAETQRIANEEERQRNSAEYKAQVDLAREEIETWQDEWGKISSFDKRIENLEAAISPEIVTPVTDSTVAYTKTVPKGALPNAAITEIGGMSYRCENLIPFPYTFGNSITTNGVTIKANADGSITLNGTLTASQVVNVDLISNYIVLPAGTYRISGIPASGNPVGFVGSLLRKDGSLETYVFHHTFTITEAKRFGLILQFAVGSSFSNQTLYPMLNKGETALPYQPYFTGLRDSKVTAVESVGANLLDMSKLDNLTSNGVVFTKNHEGKYTLSGTTTEKVQIYLSSVICDNSTKIWLSGGESGVQITVNAMRNGYFVQNIGTVQGTTIQLTQGVNYDRIEIYLIIDKGKTFSNVTFYAMLNQGSTALPYSPYFRETLPIPGDALDGFGQGVNAQYYNKIVLDPLVGVKKYVKMVKKIELNGTESISAQNYAAHFTVQQFNISGPSDIKNGIDVLCNETTSGRNAFAGNANEIGVSSGYIVIGIPKALLTPYGYVDGTSSTYVSSFKAYLKAKYDNGTPITVAYAIATPTETDVSHLFTDDNLLPVEAGGTITAVNEYEQAVPFTIEYTVKGA